MGCPFKTATKDEAWNQSGINSDCAQEEEEGEQQKLLKTVECGNRLGNNKHNKHIFNRQKAINNKDKSQRQYHQQHTHQCELKGKLANITRQAADNEENAVVAIERGIVPQDYGTNDFIREVGGVGEEGGEVVGEVVVGTVIEEVVGEVIGEVAAEVVEERVEEAHQQSSRYKSSINGKRILTGDISAHNLQTNCYPLTTAAECHYNNNNKNCYCCCCCSCSYQCNTVYNTIATTYSTNSTHSKKNKVKISKSNSNISILCDELQANHNQQQQQPHIKNFQIQPQNVQQQNTRKCCQHATTNARNTTTATMAAAACGNCGNLHQLQEMLLHARNTLATHLANVSQSLKDNVDYYVINKQQHEREKREKELDKHKSRNRLHHKQQQQDQHHKRQEQMRQQHCQQQAFYHAQQKTRHVIDTCTTPTTTTSTMPSSSNSSYNYSATTTAAYNYLGHNYYHLLRNSISFYAASSVILVLCYLTTTSSAAAANSDTAPFDRHPIQSIDWSKFDESSSDKEILDLLLEKKRYDKRLLPPVNDEDFCCGLSSPDMAKNQNSRRPHNRGTLTVNVNVLLLSLASPDESSLKYEVEFLLNQQWNDPRLQYGNKSHYDFLNALHHHDSIWTPDTYFIMHGDFKDPIIPMHFALRIYRNGTITYAMRRHLILSCQGSLHIFPFDDPKCSFSMESISYEEAQIKYVWKNDEDTLRKSPSLTTLNAYLIKNQTTACDQNSWRGNYSCLRVDLIFTRDRAFYFTTVFIPGIILVTSSFITFWLEWNAVPARSMIGNYSCLQVELTFTRDRAYYFTTVFIPGIILVTSSFITFWLEWNAVPARVMIGVTTMLNFFTTSNGFRSTLPVVSNLTAMNVWDGVCMCFIYASLLEFVCVNYVGRKRPLHNVVYRPGENPVTQRLPAVLSRIGVILASPLEVIEREFHAALSSEKAAAGFSTGSTSMPMTPTSSVGPTTSRFRWEQQHGGVLGAAMQNLRSRSMRRRRPDEGPAAVQFPTRFTEPIYTEPVFTDVPDQNTVTTTKVTLEDVPVSFEVQTTTTTVDENGSNVCQSRSISTNTPPLILRGEAMRVEIHDVGAEEKTKPKRLQLPDELVLQDEETPKKPPRKKSSRSTSPTSSYEPVEQGNGRPFNDAETGEKRRDASGPNEIVACTTCGGGSNSPCTHSVNNGCATEVRKKEPPHPIRVAKTIDVIARITFPTAYAIFLIFFFVHYKGFS